MAKKKTQSLMSGIMGSEPQKSTEEVLPANTSQETKNEPPAQRGPGRPKKSDNVGKNRATFILPTDTHKKLRYISLMEGINQQDIVAEALDVYIEKWEKENGKIKMPKK